jgi:dihydrofolate reductase
VQLKINFRDGVGAGFANLKLGGTNPVPTRYQPGPNSYILAALMESAMFSLIAAMDRNRAIGLNNRMPWHMPADLKHFKAVTMAKPIVMGRKTYESIGRPLPGRRNIVLTQQSDLLIAGCEVVTSIAAMQELLGNEPEVMVIGGANLYQQLLPLSQRMYLTMINHQFEADAYFPEWSAEEWQEVARETHPADEANPYPYSFVTLERR